MTECGAMDCAFNNKENGKHGLCTLPGEELKLDKTAACISYEQDAAYMGTSMERQLNERPWITPNEGRVRAFDNGYLINEIQRVILNATITPSGGLRASDIKNVLLKKGIRVSSQKIGKLIRYRGEKLNIISIQTGQPSREGKIYSMGAE